MTRSQKKQRTRRSAALAVAKVLAALLLISVIAVVTAFSVHNNDLTSRNRGNKSFPRAWLSKKNRRRKPRSTLFLWGQSKKSFSDDTQKVLWDEGDIGISRDNRQTGTTSFFSLYYRIYNPVKSANDILQVPPLVVLHGGP